MHIFTAILLIAAIHGQPEAIMPTSAIVAPDSTLRFPKVEGSNLEGRHFSLPNDFEGELNIVLVAFRREQQDDVDTWVPFLKSMAEAHAGLKAYELPTLNRSYRLVRRFIDGGMARGIPAKATRETTITLYIDKAPFKSALGITAEDRIVTLLVSREGRVLWRGDGRHTESAAADLASEINRRLPATTP
ncbi:MAG: hypothetical protein M3Z05_10925 [Gemmatimonadota bacterium]|nr:hypothetical protein [Gemmatimonadota bacterium]